MSSHCSLGKLGAKKPFVVSLSNYEWPFGKLRANGSRAMDYFDLCVRHRLQSLAEGGSMPQFVCFAGDSTAVFGGFCTYDGY